jgi:hypothetical protein
MWIHRGLFREELGKLRHPIRRARLLRPRKVRRLPRRNAD